VVYLGIGDKEKALDWIERAIDERRGWAAYLRVHPVVDSLRDEPRFQQLIERMTYEAPAGPALSDSETLPAPAA
jgi:hypothetical protein